MIENAIAKVGSGAHLSETEANEVFSSIMTGKCEEKEIAALLTAMHANGLPSVDELVGAARAMRAVSVKVAAPAGCVDIVGTGGDGRGTFNVSTTAAFIAAGAGVKIAKHGNRASTSKSGAADCLEALGYNLDTPVEEVAKMIATNGFGFCFANKCHPAMRFAAPVRRALPFRTIFNLLGPLTNPAGVDRLALGVFAPEVIPLYIAALKQLGAKKAVVFCGEVVNADGSIGYLDEISLAGVTHISTLEEDGSVTETVFDPKAMFGGYDPLSSIAGGTPAENAELTRLVVTGKRRDARRRAAVLNAAAAIVAGGKAKTLEEGLEYAGLSIDGSEAEHRFNAFLGIPEDVFPGINCEDHCKCCPPTDLTI